jgi:hypothetical protein
MGIEIIAQVLLHDLDIFLTVFILKFFKCLENPNFCMIFCIIFQGIEDAILGSNLYLVKPSDYSKDVEEPILEDKKRQG